GRSGLVTCVVVVVLVLGVRPLCTTRYVTVMVAASAIGARKRAGFRTIGGDHTVGVGLCRERPCALLQPRRLAPRGFRRIATRLLVRVDDPARCRNQAARGTRGE